MADIKIKKTAQETSFEAIGIDRIDIDLVKGLFDLGNGGFIGDDTNRAAWKISPGGDAMAPIRNARMFYLAYITPDMLKTAKETGRLDSLIHPFDEIDVPLDTGGAVTVVCGHVTGSGARFIFKDCWDEGMMNEEATNKGGYYKSQGRKFVLEDIWPHIAPEWKEIIKPRHLVEIIDGEKAEYDDSLWLPSATDVFGPPDGRWWNEEEDSFQLPIFLRERDRVKECGNQGTYPWWLRSVLASSTSIFCIVYTGGSAGSYGASGSLGFAPGFDI